MDPYALTHNVIYLKNLVAAATQCFTKCHTTMNKQQYEKNATKHFSPTI